MTNQEIFDFVKNYLSEQGRKSVYGTDCAYRGPDGTKCAAGCLIKDELYSEDMEGKSCDYTKIFNAIVKSIKPTDKDAFFLIRDLQIAHDNANSKDFINSFLKICERIRKDYNLS